MSFSYTGSTTGSKDYEASRPPKVLTKFKVFDAMMGSGKSTRIINDISISDEDQPFLYISPLIDECHRVAGTVYDIDDDFKRPLVISSESNDDGVKLDLYDYDESHILSGRLFKHPDYKGGSKADNLKDLIKYEHNIVSTHQLFKQLTPDMLRQAGDYILIIDEALQCYDVFTDLSDKELKALLRNKILYIDDDEMTLRFDRNEFGTVMDGESDSVDDTHYATLASLCDLGQLLHINGKVLVWELSLDTLFAFKEVWVATYLFEGSQMSAYFKGHGIEYDTISFGKKPSEIKHLINIFGYDENQSERDFYKQSQTGINGIGYKANSLSSSSITNSKDEYVEVLNKNLYNYFRHKVKSKKGDRLWTSLKSLIKPVGGIRYKDDWLAFNTKATNKYGHVHNLAYLMNLYAQPFIVHASRKKGFPIDQDMYALSEMVQWIWRSAIRNGEAINIYIPSSRMRGLLIDWLNGKYDK